MTSTRSLSFVLLGVRAKKLLGRRAGECVRSDFHVCPAACPSISHPWQMSHTKLVKFCCSFVLSRCSLCLHPPARLLEVFDRLRDISAAASNESAQNELIGRARIIVQDICTDHIVAANSFVQDESLRASVTAEIEHECQSLVEYLEVAKRFNLEINSRAKDRVVGFGEKLSCRFMTCLLKDRVCLANSRARCNSPR